ncbi:MAG: hypothetical protein ABSB82_15545 [Terriglobia bacterium]|jgi:hypothetical protein
MSRRIPEAEIDGPRPEVIVDFIAEEGLLYVVLQNIGASSALGASAVFDKPFHGLEGRKCISAMQLFKRVEFMPPGKKFVQLVDSLAAYFKRREPTRITVTVSYTSREGRKFQEVIKHDLRIYRDLGYTKTRT